MSSKGLYSRLIPSHNSAQNTEAFKKSNNKTAVVNCGNYRDRCFR